MRPTLESTNMLQIGVLVDSLSTRIYANYRDNGGNLHDGVYKAQHTIGQGSAIQALYHCLYSLERKKASFALIYTNDATIAGMSKLLSPGKDRDLMLVCQALTRYRMRYGVVKFVDKIGDQQTRTVRGGFDCILVKPEILKKCSTL